MAIQLFSRKTITSSKVYQYLYSFSDCDGSVNFKPACASGHLMGVSQVVGPHHMAS